MVHCNSDLYVWLRLFCFIDVVLWIVSGPCRWVCWTTKWILPFQGSNTYGRLKIGSCKQNFRYFAFSHRVNHEPAPSSVNIPKTIQHHLQITRWTKDSDPFCLSLKSLPDVWRTIVIFLQNHQTPVCLDCLYQILIR